MADPHNRRRRHSPGLIPILPFLLAYVLNPMWKLVEKFSVVVRPKVLATFGAITLVALNLSMERQAANISQSMGYPLLKPMEEPISWSSYEEVFRWIRENTVPTDVIASGLDTTWFISIPAAAGFGLLWAVRGQCFTGIKHRP